RHRSCSRQSTARTRTCRACRASPQSAALRPRLRRSNRGLTELLVQSDRQVFRQIPRTVHRQTKRAKQVTSALLRCTEVSPPTVELGHERRFRNTREESAHTPTTDVKPSGDDRR